MKQQMPTDHPLGTEQGRPVGILPAGLNLRKEHVMSKTLEVIREAIRDPKHPFRKVENRPKKAQKHRYERRKIREYLHLADWLTEETT